jgi:regulator of RNase E activity RraA
MMNELDSSVFKRLGVLPTAVIGDTLREMGFHHQALNHKIAGLDRSMRCCGPAFCIEGETSVGDLPKNEPGALIPSFEIFRRPLEDHVLVIATGGFEGCPVWGGNIALSAQLKQVAGVVADGGVRDVVAITEIGVPTWATFITPVSSAKRWRITQFGSPIVMPGQTHSQVVITPGDAIVADADGVMVVPARLAQQVAESAEELERIELVQRNELLSGDDRQAVYERYDRFGHIPKTR